MKVETNFAKVLNFGKVEKLKRSVFIRLVSVFLLVFFQYFEEIKKTNKNV